MVQSRTTPAGETASTSFGSDHNKHRRLHNADSHDTFTKRQKFSDEQNERRGKALASRLERERRSILSPADMNQVFEILREEASFADEHGVEYIDYEGMLRVQDRAHSLWGRELDRCFRPTTFLKLRGLGGAVEVDILIEYVRRYVEMRRLHLEISAYDRSARGLLTLRQLEDYLGQCRLFEGQGLVGSRAQLAREVAVQKFAFHHAIRHGQTRVVDLLTSAVMEEMQDVRRAMGSVAEANRVAGSGSWFSRQVIETVLDAFSELDRRGCKSITLDMLLTFDGAKFSRLFAKRLFEEHTTGGGALDGGATGEMTLTDFARFVVAWRDRCSPAAVRYFFPIFDIHKRGYLDYFDVRMFFKDIHTMWTACGQEGHDDPNMCENVVTEIFEMVNPAVPGQISKEDLNRCGKAMTVIGVMSDMWEFWRHEHGDGEAEIEVEGEGGFLDFDEEAT